MVINCGLRSTALRMLGGVPVPAAGVRRARLTAVLALVPVLVLLLAGAAVAQEIPTLPAPTAEPTQQPKPSPKPTTPSAAPEPAPTQTGAAASPAPTRAPVRSARPTGASATPDSPSPPPSTVEPAMSSHLPVSPPPGTPAADQQGEATETVASSSPSDPLTRLVQLVVGAAVLLGVGGGTGLYLTREGR